MKLTSRPCMGLLGALGALLLFACSSDAPTDSSSPSSPTSVTELATGYQTVAVSIPATVEEATEAPRALTMSTEFNLVAGSGVSIKPVIKDKDSRSSFLSLVTLYNKTRNARHTQEASWTRADRGSLGNHYFIQNLELPSTWSLSDELYLLAVSGGEQTDSQKDRLSINNPTSLDPIAIGGSIQRQVPFATAWRKLSLSSSSQGNSSLQLADTSTPEMKTLRFKPQGIMLLINAENWMTLDVQIKRSLILEANGLASQGYYDFSKVNAANISDGADRVHDLWVSTNPETEGSRTNSEFRNHSDAYRHRRIDFTLNAPAGQDHSYIRLTKRVGSTAIKDSSYYLLWLQRPQGDALKNVFFGEVDVTEAGRTRFTNNPDTYRNPIAVNTWKPYLGKRYILGSINLNGTKTGSVYTSTLRVVRPVLPIERIGIPGYSYDNEPRGSNSKNSEAGVRAGWYSDFSSGSNRRNYNFTYWRMPTERELGNFARIPSHYLTNSRPVTGTANVRAQEVGGRLYLFNYTGTPQSTRINGRELWPGNHFIREKNAAPVIYGLMYMARSESPTQTANYRVAVRMTYNQSARTMKIDHYYLGPNLYAMTGNNEAGSNLGALYDYIMHPMFWEHCIDKDAILTRTIPFHSSNGDNTKTGDQNEYWVDNGSKWIKVTNYGILEGSGTNSRTSAYIWPWLKDEYQPW